MPPVSHLGSNEHPQAVLGWYDAHGKSNSVPILLADTLVKVYT